MHAPRRPIKRILSVAALVGLLAWSAGAAEPPGPRASTFTVTWFEMPVHGLAVVLETPSGKAIVIDAGGRNSKEPSYNAGRDAIAPYLKLRGFDEIAHLAISHPHGDHYGGAQWLLENGRVRQFIDSGYEGRGLNEEYRQLRKLAEQKAVYRSAHAGDRLDWDEQLDVEVLSPPHAFLELGSDPKKITEHGLLNGNSLVIRVRHGENVFFFPGDAYGMGQRFLLAQVAPEKLRTTVMTAPHHGFNTSAEFAAATKPAVVVASCLADYPGSEIRSPADQALKMYKPVGAKVYATCRHGRIQVVSDARTITVKTERDGDRGEANP